MRPDILIVGQGLAGTWLGVEFERAGIPFRVADVGHARAASRIAAGIINPITGRRLVKTWAADEFLPFARSAYQALETAWGVSLWRDMRVRRLFASDDERRIFRQRQARGELAPFAGEADRDGFWIEGAGRVDLPAMLATARTRWKAMGVLTEESRDAAMESSRHELAIDCTGAAANSFSFIPWEFSKGEILSLSVGGLDPDVILNRGHWILPVGPHEAKIGATHEPGRTDPTPTAAARTTLETSAAALLDRPFAVTAHDVGIRVNLPDRRPVTGRHPQNQHLGLLNGLGAKGVLLAPWLARQWVNHLTEGVPFRSEVDIARFWHRDSSQDLSLKT